MATPSSSAQSIPPQTYRGRFAPSPTGPLHFGSLIAAVASYLQARVSDGVWLVRIEDLDPPREVPGAADSILNTLERFGFEWDETVVYQSKRTRAYESALASLESQSLVFPCACSRKEILAANGGRAGSPKLGPVYPGTCRNGLPPGRSGSSTRVRVGDRDVEFRDALQGRYSQNLECEGGDFVIRRSDGLFAYQLAVVVDDADQAITEIVRGCDLLETTPRQIYLQGLLGFTTPLYMHVPVVVSSSGQKLSKQTGAQPVDRQKPPAALYNALTFLGQEPPAGLHTSSLDEIWSWAMENWRLSKTPSGRQRHFDSV